MIAPQVAPCQPGNYSNSRRETDEAYLAADPGKAYILYFTKKGAGSVGLKLDTLSGDTFELRWVNVDTGDWGPTRRVTGGSTVTIERPDATAHWVATVRRYSSNNRDS